MHIVYFKCENLLQKCHIFLFDLTTLRNTWKFHSFKIILTYMLLLSPPGFCLMDLTEQFCLPDTAPPMLVRLLEAIERKGESNKVTFCCTSGFVHLKPYFIVLIQSNMKQLPLVTSVSKCNSLCSTQYFQVWIIPRYIEHSLLVLDLKSDSILMVSIYIYITLITFDQIWRLNDR